MSEIARLVPRLSGTERLILDLLRQSELFGLQLVDRSEGALKRGTVYVTLGRMQDKGYVESRTEPLPAGRDRPASPLVSPDRVWTEGASTRGCWRRVRSRRRNSGPARRT